MAQLTSNIDNLQTILETVNGLPEAGATDASAQIAAHNSSTTAHADIREILNNKSNTGHTHNASDITEGTLAVERLEASGVTANSYGPTGSVTTGTFNVPQITVDTYGRVTRVVNRSVTLPAAGSGGDSGTTNPYVLPTASSDELGGVKIGYTTSGKNYAVELDETDKMFVNVPWTDNNTTYSSMTAATASSAGQGGLVPAPAAGKQTSFLRGDGTWAIPTNTTYDNATTTTAGLMSAADKTKLNAITDSADSVSFSRNLTSGTKIGTLTINGNNTDLYCETNTDTNTTYSQGTGISISGTTISAKLNSTTSLGTIGSTSKLYAVGVDANGKLCVNVPWTDTNTHAVTSVFGRTGAVTLTKSDVTSALGYTPPESDTNTHYTTRLYAGASGTASNGSTTNPYLKVTDNNTYRNQVRFIGSGATSISSDTDGNITISSTDSYPGVASYNSYGIVKIDSSSLTVSSGTLKLTSSDITNILGYTPANSANVPDTSSFVTNTSLTTTLSSYAKKTDIPAAYTLPNATTTTKGGVIVGSNISVSSGTISLTKSNVTTALGYTPPTTNTTYTAGTGISISASNVISCSVSAYTLPSATTSTLGGVRFGYGALSSRPSTASVGTIYLATS